MQRRKFIIGAGALAAGGAAGLGTGAFTVMDAEREVDINVVADPDGLIGLQPGGSAGDIVGLSDNSGELYIDFTSAEGGEGVNINSRYQVGGINTNPIYASWGLGWNGYPWNPIEDHAPAEGGDPGHSMDRAAFIVTNQSDSEREVTLTYEADTDDTLGAFLYFQASASDTSGQSGTSHIGIMNEKTSGSLTLTVSPGEWIGVSFGTSTIDVDSAVEDVDLSGTLTVDAE